MFGLDQNGNGILQTEEEAPFSCISLEECIETDDDLFIDFLRSLLQIDPQNRLSAADALQHRWLQTGVFSSSRT
jgi:serine/threonine protein kinase